MAETQNFDPPIKDWGGVEVRGKRDDVAESIILFFISIVVFFFANGYKSERENLIVRGKLSQVDVKPRSPKITARSKKPSRN